MENNIFLEIEYLGSHYFGFQIQEKKGKREITVQSVVEEALRKLFKQKIRIAYAGRTDRGVHAKGQVINFKVDSSIPLKNIKVALNTLLPCDIRVKKVKKALLDFHSRFWAKSKIYEYVILNKSEPSVFWEHLSWQITEKLDLEKIKKISKKLVGKKDFFLFAKEAKKYLDCTREIKSISVKKKGSFIHIYIEADGFLRNMVRNIVSFLVKVGRGKISPKEVSLILAKKKPYINKPAPAQGLYLLKVKYAKI
ncbi:MAG: tRNA pseudouridine(38-40) synthase TruA [Candidatus Omnitrophica bacterium]|jgi:tRNA pseudouridine38-40 synthase|nr:tRNA pseudouridine(38-40) synthase TruA [Candidatus Omnitrophota bacterium]